MADLGDDQNLPSADDVSVVFDETQVPEDEREEILKEIETRVLETHRTGTLGDEYLRPHRSGVVFPVIINLIAAAAIAGGIYFISEYFRVREDSIALESRSYFSAEAQLIEEILRESEQRLAQKDQEIGQIQSQLALLDEEKQNLEANLEDQVARRESELRAELDAELAAERARLAGLGQSEDAIEARLREIETQRQDEFAAQLDGFRAEAQAELDQLAAQLSARESQLEQTLQASREERSRIAQDAADREQQLREELGAEIEALEEAEQEAQTRIAQLQALREQESLLSDRVLGSFAVVVEDIQEGRSEVALSGLDSLERLLQDQSPADAGAQRRRRTELALASTLRGLVQEVDVLRDNIAVRDLTTTDEQEANLEQQRAAELIATAAGVVELAENARTTGRINEARSLYQQALSTIPSLDQVYPGLLALEADRRQVVMQSALGEAQSLLAAGSSEAAIATYLAALTDIAEGEQDPLQEVAAGIETATAQNQQDLLDAQQELEEEYRAELSANTRSIANLNQQLLTTRNQVSSRDATITGLRAQLTTLNQQLSTREESLAGRADALETALDRVTQLEDEISTLEVDLQTARTRATSLQQSLTAARAQSAVLQEREASLVSSEAQLRAQATSLQAEIEALERQVATLEQQLASRPAPTSETGPSPAAAAEIETLRTQVNQLNATVSQREASISGLEDQVESVRDSLRTAENERDSARTELEAARQQISGLRDQIASLRTQRDTVSGESSSLEEQMGRLTEEVAILTAYRNRVETLTAGYESAQTTAGRLAAAANYESARARLLTPLRSETANEILPGLVDNLERIYTGLISQAENRSSAEARSTALDDVTGLAEQVKKNIDDPSGSAAVQSYLRREPDVAGVANDIFEIIELAARDLSAPEVEYTLLGSVSRATGNLVVVERLVALTPAVGDVVEIRRTPELGQEVPVALGTIIEVTARRVVVSADRIYQLDILPAIGDVVYLAQE